MKSSLIRCCSSDRQGSTFGHLFDAWSGMGSVFLDLSGIVFNSFGALDDEPRSLPHLLVYSPDILSQKGQCYHSAQKSVAFLKPIDFIDHPPADEPEIARIFRNFNLGYPIYCLVSNFGNNLHHNHRFSGRVLQSRQRCERLSEPSREPEQLNAAVRVACRQNLFFGAVWRRIQSKNDFECAGDTIQKSAISGAE